MPPDPRAGSPTVNSLAAQPEGWFVDFGSGDTREVVCWGNLSDGTGAVPMVFNSSSGKLVSALTKGTGYRLIHSAGPAVADSIATLIDAQTEPGTGQVFSLGGFYSRKTIYATVDNPSTAFSARVEGSADGDQWIEFCDLNGPDIKSYVELTVHYVRAILDSVSGGSATIRMAWS